MVGVALRVLAVAGGATLALTVSCGDAPGQPTARASETAAPEPTPTTPAVAPSSPPTPPPTPANVEIRKVQLFPDSKDSKVLHVVAEVHNLGPGVAVAPRAKVSLKSKGGGMAVDQAVCAPHVEFLPAGKAAPCEATFSRGMDWSEFAVEPDSYPVEVTSKLVPLSVANAAYQPPDGLFSPHKVRADVTNPATHPAANAWAMAGLYAADGRLIGVGAAHIAGGELGAGVTAEAVIDVYEIAGAVAHFELVVVGYEH